MPRSGASSNEPAPSRAAERQGESTIEALAPVIFYSIKLALYTAWVHFGLSQTIPPPASPPRWLSAAGWAAARLAVGFVLGSAILLIFSSVAAAARPANRLGIPEFFGAGSWAVTYFAVYTPIRFAEWAILARFMTGGDGSRVNRERWWAAGGTLLSFATDLAGGIAAIAAVGGIC